MGSMVIPPKNSRFQTSRHFIQVKQFSLFRERSLIELIGLDSSKI